MCGEKFRLQYLEKDRRPAGPQAARGRAIHGVAKEAHKRQMVDLGKWTGDAPLMTNLPGTVDSVQEAKDLAADQFEKSIAEGVAYSKDEKEIGVDKVRASQKDATVALSGLYVGEVAPIVVPEAVERKVEVHPKDMDITIVGYIDLIESDNGDVIRDLKTSEKKPWKGAAAVSQQLTLYHYLRAADTLHEKKEIVLPRAGKLVHLVRTPVKHDMSIVVQETTRDMEDVKILAHRIRAAVAAVEAGIFTPADPAAPGSPCSWCQYADGTCKYVRKVGRPIPQGYEE
jgi:hypothetical protein